MIMLKIIISDTVLLALIGSVTGLLTIWLNHRLGKIHKQINSRMDELLKISKAEALAEGTLKGRADEKAENIVIAHSVLPPETKIEGTIEGTIKPKENK